MQLRKPRFGLLVQLRADAFQLQHEPGLHLFDLREHGLADSIQLLRHFIAYRRHLVRRLPAHLVNLLLEAVQGIRNALQLPLEKGNAQRVQRRMLIQHIGLGTPAFLHLRNGLFHLTLAHSVPDCAFGASERRSAIVSLGIDRRGNGVRFQRFIFFLSLQRLLRARYIFQYGVFGHTFFHHVPVVAHTGLIHRSAQHPHEHVCDEIRPLECRQFFKLGFVAPGPGNKNPFAHAFPGHPQFKNHIVLGLFAHAARPQPVRSTGGIRFTAQNLAVDIFDKFRVVQHQKRVVIHNLRLIIGFGLRGSRRVGFFPRSLGRVQNGREYRLFGYAVLQLPLQIGQARFVRRPAQQPCIQVFDKFPSFKC